MGTRDKELKQYARSVGVIHTVRPEAYHRVLFDHITDGSILPRWREQVSVNSGVPPLSIDYRQKTVQLLWRGRDSAKAGDLAAALAAFETAEKCAAEVNDVRLQALAVADLVKTRHALGLLPSDAPVRTRAHSALPTLRRDYPETAREVEALFAAECPAAECPAAEPVEIERARAALEDTLAREEAERVAAHVAAHEKQQREAEIAALRSSLLEGDDPWRE